MRCGFPIGVSLWMAMPTEQIDVLIFGSQFESSRPEWIVTYGWGTYRWYRAIGIADGGSLE